jgi:hypothetical protein
MNWEKIKTRLTKSDEMICDECNGTGKLKTKPLWVDLVLIGIIVVLTGILVLAFYLQYYFSING